ncbi:MAG: nitroreductase family protein [Desulfobacterales bacterium]
MDIYESIALRKSVRDFTDKDIPVAVMTRVLDGARLAASASNRQEWRFVVVKQPETRAKLGEAAFGQNHVSQAPAVIACCADTDEHAMPCGQLSYPIDLGIAVTHITLCAAAEGLGTCWIGAFDENQVKTILDIPARIRVVALLPIGYPRDPGVVKKERLPMDIIVQYEKWSA